MRKPILFALLAVGIVTLFALPVFSQQVKETQNADAKPPVVIAAAATSYGEGSSSVVCLLDPTCSGSWTPMSKDGGVNEGIYIQFKEPFAVSGIDVVMEGNVASGNTVTLKPYFDGMMGADPAIQKYRKNKAAQNDAECRKARREAQREIDKPDYDGPGDLPCEPDQAGNLGDPLNVDAQFEPGTELTHFMISGSSAGVKSLYFKIDDVAGATPPKVRSIRFYDTSAVEAARLKAYNECKEIKSPTGCESAWSEGLLAAIEPSAQALSLPVSVKASVAASSVLSPEIAYGPEHLFDSQTDMAWATDGQKTSGIGESLTVTLAQRQKIQGLMLWNGYQRSEAHFKANGRVRTLVVNNVTVPVQDTTGMQVIHLPQPLDTDRFVLTIKDIYKGTAYKDVLISELRLLTPDGRIILPQVEGKSATLPEWADPLQDATYASFIQTITVGDKEIGYANSSLRIRSNGSFVIYSDVPDVIEGNWEMGQDGHSLQFFGKKYGVPLTEELGYFTLSKKTAGLPGPRIFRSQVKVTRFTDLPEAEQRGALAFLVGRGLEKASRTDGKERVTIGLDPRQSGPVSGENLDAALTALMNEARKLDPFLVKSDVYTELLLPRWRGE